MIIPVRCFTCNTILADKYEWFIREIKKVTGNNELNILDVSAQNIEKTIYGKNLDELKLHKYCCRRIMLGHIDLIDII